MKHDHIWRVRDLLVDFGTRLALDSSVTMIGVHSFGPNQDVQIVFVVNFSFDDLSQQERGIRDSPSRIEKAHG